MEGRKDGHDFWSERKSRRNRGARVTAKSIPVRAVVRDLNKAKNLADAGCELSKADLRDVKSIMAALGDATSALVICPMTAKAPDALVEPYLTIDAISEAVKKVFVEHYSRVHACQWLASPALAAASQIQVGASGLDVTRELHSAWKVEDAVIR
jgi:uncharacterized protein YbjT (DUF2867 family)